jgi:imidazolonepropionase-like amidohydrolase
MAHAHSTEGIKNGLRAGVRSVEHGTYLDDECIELSAVYASWAMAARLRARISPTPIWFSRYLTYGSGTF